MNRIARKIGILIAVVFSALASRATAADLAAWPLMPYRVRVVVAVAPAPSLSPRFDAALREGLAERIGATIGSPWNATMSPPSAALGRAMLRDPTRLPEALSPIAKPEWDKLLLVAVATEPDGWRITARDYDVRTHMLSPPVVRRVWQAGVLCDATFDAMVSAFSPLARIDRIESNRLILRVKGAGLPPRDPRWAMVRVGDVYRPILRYHDRQGDWRRASPARWSFAVVERVSSTECRCRSFSAMRSELFARGRGRAEAMALRVVPPRGASTLTILARTGTKRPLGGYEVRAYPPAKKSATAWIGRTDGQGRVVIPPGDGLLRIVSIQSGNDVVARLPIVPGLEPRLTIELADDAGRLEAEGFIAGLEDELVDLLARRKILMLRVAARIDNGQLGEASRLLRELRDLPTVESFAARIREEQARHASADAQSREKIQALLDQARRAVERSLDAREIDDLEERLRKAEVAPEPKKAERASAE